MTATLSVRKLVHGGLLCLWLLFATASAEECNKENCPGPLRFYEDVKCKPIYENGDCCPSKFDCSHLENRPTDKCYANGNEYALGERLRDEDRVNPCDLGCFCSKFGNNPPRFTCAIVDCFPTEPKPGCYFKGKLDSCCGREEICLENPEDRPKCEVDGQTYLEGEVFYPSNTTSQACLCLEGYEGKNVAPFCKKTTCGTEQRRLADINNNCAPIYELHHIPAKACTPFFRCQNVNDTVIASQGPNKPSIETCKFGDLKLHLGDELSHSTHYAAQCVKCVCEVPPTLTCKRLTQEECAAYYPERH